MSKSEVPLLFIFVSLSPAGRAPLVRLDADGMRSKVYAKHQISTYAFTPVLRWTMR